MKLVNDDIQFLKKSALDYGLKLSRRQLELFHVYLDELWEWNRKINMTGIQTRRRMVIELFLDSLIPAPFLPERGRLLDVGSGAGFPGIPLNIHNPRLSLYLLEINSKKISFLRHTVRILRLDKTTVIKGRIGNKGCSLHPMKYHVITARAVAGLSRVITWCAPFIRSGGLLVTFLGRNADEELVKSGEVMQKEDISLLQAIPYYLPGKKFGRNTMIFQKGN